jgi:Ca-activated chloride channel homolog
MMPSGISRGVIRVGAATGCLTCVLAAGPLLPQPPPVVLLDVAVEDADGHVVAGLSRNDFDITTDGGARPIESFATGREQPLSLVLLFDATTSMDSTIKRSVVRNGVEKWFADRLAPRDRVHVGSFARQTSIGPPISNNPKALLSAVHKALDPREADTLGPSPIWDAVDAAVAALANAEGRRAVLLVTDGRGTGNRLNPEEAALRAAAAGVAVSVVGEDWEMTIRQDGNTGVRVRPGVALERIANATGGLYLPDRSNPPAPGPILERLLEDLHARYTLGFTPPVSDGKLHELDVRVRRPGLKLRARRLYAAPTEP